MSLSRRSVETLIDLVEIKLSCLEVFDRQDAREKACLEMTLRELQALAPQRRSAEVVPFARPAEAQQKAAAG
jgi:hypothetical protein